MSVHKFLKRLVGSLPITIAVDGRVVSINKNTISAMEIIHLRPFELRHIGVLPARIHYENGPWYKPSGDINATDTITIVEGMTFQITDAEGAK